MIDDQTFAALKAALAFCDAVQASPQTERALLEHADRFRRIVMIAVCRDGAQPDDWQGAR